MSRHFFGAAVGVLAMGLFGGVVLADPTPVPVPNGSFEQPSAAGVPFGTLPFPYAGVSWQHSPEPPSFATNPYYAGQLTWDDMAGVFANPSPSSPGYISNMNGAQAGFLFAVSQNSMFQTLPATYQPGKSYSLVVSAIGGGNYASLPVDPNATLDMTLFYTDIHGNHVPVADAQALAGSSGEWPQFVNFEADLPTVNPGDPWAGQPIGIELAATSDSPYAYWDVDNVRLVPEPASLALLAGAAGLGLVRRRR